MFAFCYFGFFGKGGMSVVCRFYLNKKSYYKNIFGDIYLPRIVFLKVNQIHTHRNL